MTSSATISVLKPGGRLGFIVSNKWLRAGYAERLGGHLAERTAIERLVDFGHAPIFPDADAFPVIVSVRKLAKKEVLTKDHTIAVTQFPREQLHKVEVPAYVAEHTTELPQARLSVSAWSLENDGLEALFNKMRGRAVPLREYAGVKPFYGVKTGCNEAFLVNTATRDRLVREDAHSADILKKFLRGQDVSRWASEWAGLWMIFSRRGIDIDAYPAIKRHLEGFREKLEPRPPTYQGKDWPGRKPGSYKWYELQDAIDYHAEFIKPKMVFPDPLWRGDFAMDRSGSFTNNTTYIMVAPDPWLLGVLNSPLMWSYLWAHAQHAKDEALRMFGEFVERIPIARPSAAQRSAAERLVDRLISAAGEMHAQRAAVLDVLRMQHGIDKPGNVLSGMESLASDDFMAEVLKRRPRPTTRLSAAGQRELRQFYEEEVAPMQARHAAIRAAERDLSRLVNQAYGLTPADERLLWDTAPPRMPRRSWRAANGTPGRTRRSGGRWGSCRRGRRR